MQENENVTKETKTDNNKNLQADNKFIIEMKILTLIMLSFSAYYHTYLPRLAARIGNAIGLALGIYIILMLLTYLPLLLIKNKNKRREVSAILIFVISLIYSVYLLFV